MSVAGFIADQRTEHDVPHAITCRALEVSESWFYKWRRRPAEPTKREMRRAELTERIKHHFEASGGIYGSLRITLGLWAEGWQISRCSRCRSASGRWRPSCGRCRSRTSSSCGSGA